MTDWLPLVQSIGIPGTILLGVAYALWKIIPWIGSEVVLPAVKTHLDFVNSAKASIEQMAARLTEFGVDLHKIGDAQAKLAESQATLARSQTKLTDAQVQVATESVKVLKTGNGAGT
jgi:hypothetical protein